MILLGVQNDLDAGAALLIDGQLVGAVNEERFTRVKLQRGFPSRSIEFLLGRAGITFAEVDQVVYGWTGAQGIDARQTLPELTRRIAEAVARDPGVAEMIQQRVDSEVRNQAGNLAVMRKRLAELGGTARFVQVDHHESHASAAFRTSPFEEALVVTMDGKGDFRSGSVWHGRGEELLPLDSLSTLDSPGYFYAIITKCLGFKPERHEGKITGLAAYGDPERLLPVMRKVIDFEGGRIRTRLGPWYRPWFVGPEGVPALWKEIEKASREDVAAAAQRQLETVVCAWVARFLATTGLSRVALAGGVFANVKLNQRIRELPGVTDVYVHPNMGDGGLPLGSALQVWSQMGRRFARPLARADLGPEFDDRTIAEQIRAAGAVCVPVADRVDAALRVLRARKVVGWFQGRMEYGPRALCRRSILFHTRDQTANDWLNKRMARTEFMPFAPVTTSEMAGRCFLGWKPEDFSSRFMTMTFDCTSEFKEDSPAVVHVDGTARPQVVFREDDPATHGLLSRWCEEERAMSLINTSFNHHEEPIVCTPDDAARSMLRGNVDVLVAGSTVSGEEAVLRELGFV